MNRYIIPFSLLGGLIYTDANHERDDKLSQIPFKFVQGVGASYWAVISLLYLENLTGASATGVVSAWLSGYLATYFIAPPIFIHDMKRKIRNVGGMAAIITTGYFLGKRI